MVVPMLQFKNVLGHADVQIAGLLSLACAFISLTHSCLLVISFGASKTEDEQADRAQCRRRMRLVERFSPRRITRDMDGMVSPPRVSRKQDIQK
jgi:hypothetical protein